MAFSLVIQSKGLEEKVVEGHYPYAKIIEYLKQKGATMFDAERIRVPEIPTEEIMAFVASVKEER